DSIIHRGEPRARWAGGQRPRVSVVERELGDQGVARGPGGPPHSRLQPVSTAYAQKSAATGGSRQFPTFVSRTRMPGRLFWDPGCTVELYDTSCSYPPATGSALMKSLRLSVRAGWEKCTRRAIRGWGARSPSSCCEAAHRRAPIGSRALCRRLAR